MKGLSICRRDEVEVGEGHPIAGHRAHAVTSRLLSPEAYSLWMVELSAHDAATVALPSLHGDEIVYVVAGAARIDGHMCGPGGAIVIESGGTPTLEISAGSVVLHMGPSDAAVPVDGLNGPITAAPDRVHVVGPEGWLSLSSPGRLSKYYADSTCDGCRATLLYTSRDDAYVSPPHSHSVDELIHLVWGEIRLGSHLLGPGDTLAVAADQRYGFRSDSGFGFLNYRRDASRQALAGGEAITEGGLVNGFRPTGQVIDLKAKS